jgi:hypothetical protein
MHLIVGLRISRIGVVSLTARFVAAGTSCSLRGPIAANTQLFSALSQRGPPQIMINIDEGVLIRRQGCSTNVTLGTLKKDPFALQRTDGTPPV